MYYIGHIGDENIMGGVGMGNVLQGMLCISFCFGLNGTLESKVSQSFGAREYTMCGVWLNRGWAINTVLLVPIALLFISSGFLLKLVGQPEKVADYACTYCTLMIPGVWCTIQFDATKRFCASQFKPGLPFYS